MSRILQAVSRMFRDMMGKISPNQITTMNAKMDVIKEKNNNNQILQLRNCHLQLENIANLTLYSSKN